MQGKKNQDQLEKTCKHLCKAIEKEIKHYPRISVYIKSNNQKEKPKLKGKKQKDGKCVSSF